MNNELPKRKNIRIPGYDYSKPGYYFITICTKNRKNILSRIVGVGVPDDPYNKYVKKQLQNCDNYQIQLTYIGTIVEKYINSINYIYKEIKIDNYVIMPNHVHMVCVISKNNNESSRTPNRTKVQIPFLVSTFKRFINKECNNSIWQRNYYEHVIRNENEYIKILEYIENNPFDWKNDKYFLE